MDVNSLLSNELGVVALPYSIVSSNGASTPQDAATLVSMPTVLSPEDAQWIPDANGSVLLTFSAINGIPVEKGQEADSSTTFLPFVPSLFLTENGTLVSGQLDGGSPQTVTFLEPSIADSPQTVIDIEPSPLTGDQVLTSVLESGSDNSPLPTIAEDLANSEFAASGKDEQLFDESFNDIVSMVILYKCKLCDFKCEDKDELAKHLNVHKNKSDSIKTKRRSKPTKVINKPGREKKKKAVNPSHVVEGEDCNTHMFFSCGACLKVCTSMDELREHMKKIHGIKKDEDEEEEDEAGVDSGEDPPLIDLSVPEVIESLAEVENEDEELRVETITTPLVDGLRELKFLCTMCKLRFSTRVNMERHRKCHNPDYNGPGVPKFKCLVCGQVYNRWTFCQAHLWLVHQIDMDLHTCLICDYKTVHRDKYLSHQKRHQQLKEFACRYCAKQFSQKTQLRNHEVLHMKKNADAKLPDWAKPKECDHCHKTFCDSKALKKHVKTVHSKLKPYVCQVCGHCSARKGMFQLHIRQHTGDKPFSCSACDFTTRDHNSLRRHTMRHTGVRQYQCKFCSYSAIQAQLFKQHLIKNHGGDGVFLCNICSFSTLNEQAFIYHHHDDDQKPEKDSEDKPTVIYVPFNEKDKSSKKGSGELIAINLPDDEESNNFFDHEATIDTGGITIVEDVEEDKKDLMNSLTVQTHIGSGKLIAINLADDEESNNFFDHEATIDTGGITIVEDVGEDKKDLMNSLSTQGRDESLMDLSMHEDIMDRKDVSANGASPRNDIATTKWGIPENVDDSTLF